MSRHDVTLRPVELLIERPIGCGGTRPEGLPARPRAGAAAGAAGVAVARAHEYAGFSVYGSVAKNAARSAKSPSSRLLMKPACEPT